MQRLNIKKMILWKSVPMAAKLYLLTLPIISRTLFPGLLRIDLKMGSTGEARKKTWWRRKTVLIVMRSNFRIKKC